MCWVQAFLYVMLFEAYQRIIEIESQRRLDIPYGDERHFWGEWLCRRYTDLLEYVDWVTHIYRLRHMSSKLLDISGAIGRYRKT